MQDTGKSIEEGYDNQTKLGILLYEIQNRNPFQQFIDENYLYPVQPKSPDEKEVEVELSLPEGLTAKETSKRALKKSFSKLIEELSNPVGDFLVPSSWREEFRKPLEERGFKIVFRSRSDNQVIIRW